MSDFSKYSTYSGCKYKPDKVKNDDKGLRQEQEWSVDSAFEAAMYLAVTGEADFLVVQ